MVSMKSEKNGLLTEKQAAVLGYIAQILGQEGRPPTFRDIAEHCGYDAVGTVQDHVRALIKKGFLHKEPGVARGLRLAHRSHSIDVPILGTVPAGKPIEAIEDTLGTISIPARFRGDIYALRVSGESMVDAGIMDGDFVIVHKQFHADHGDIVVAMIDGEATVKTLDKECRDGVRLLPANPRFSSIEIPPESDNVIQGEVVSVQRYYT
jgi:repressor LexA